MTQSSLSLPSFAKINLSLRILGRRSDGYHEVDTLLQTISIHDDLHFELSGDGLITLTCDDPSIPTGAENLIVRAAETLRDRYQIDSGARIKLQKRIPAQGGLGGASSNATMTLLALAKLWKLEAPASELAEIAGGLGSDNAFFLFGGCARATGTGSTVFPLSDGELQHLIVITPNVFVSTAEAYAAFSSSSLTRVRSVPILSSSRRGVKSGDSRQETISEGLKNDFESVIFDSEPEIRRAKEVLLQAGARGALLAGSGSSVFGIFGDEETQQRAINEIRAEVGWRIFSCVTVSRTEYLRALGSCGIDFLRAFNSGFDIGA